MRFSRLLTVDWRPDEFPAVYTRRRPLAVSSCAIFRSVRGSWLRERTLRARSSGEKPVWKSGSAYRWSSFHVLLTPLAGGEYERTTEHSTRANETNLHIHCSTTARLVVAGSAPLTRMCIANEWVHFGAEPVSHPPPTDNHHITSLRNYTHSWWVVAVGMVGTGLWRSIGRWLDGNLLLRKHI